MIFNGQLPPGSNHFEQDLAGKLGMSRTPVREAALTLEAQGLVAIEPRRGVKILGLSVEDMSDIYDVLSALEALAAKRTALRLKEGHVSIANLAILRESTEQMQRALARSDREGWATADEVFHSELVRLAGNSHLEDTVARTMDQVRRARLMTLHLRPLPHASTEDHTAVLAAIENGDADRAHDLHLAHRHAARDMMVDLLRNIGTHHF